MDQNPTALWESKYTPPQKKIFGLCKLFILFGTMILDNKHFVY